MFGAPARADPASGCLQGPGGRTSEGKEWSAEDRSCKNCPECGFPAEGLLCGWSEGTSFLTPGKAGDPGVGSHGCRAEEGVRGAPGEAVEWPEESTCPQCGARESHPQEGEVQT